MDVEAGMFTVQQTMGSVACCKCGISMTPNAANMCVRCLRSEVHITEDLEKQVTIIHCPECVSYLQPPRTWIKALLESKQLLTFCVRRLKNLSKLKLIHAEFIWTEPHSKRLKVKLRVQKEVLNGAVLEQAHFVEYVVVNQMCNSCSRGQANPDQWVASVQLRQHVSHRRTFYYLEQLILKHDAAVRAIGIKQTDQGIDFYFNSRSHAVKFVDFVGKVAPVKSRHDKRLVSHDQHNNIFNYKYTFSVEICPICREDLVCLPPKLVNSLGNLGPLVICTKVSNSIALIDPSNLRHCYLDAEQYFRVSFKSLLTSKRLVEYVVLDVDLLCSEVNLGGSKYALAEVQVARVSDFGKNDTMFTVKTHLGHLLNVGDYALGYDLYSTNNNDMELDKYKGLVLPEVILVKKSYEETKQKKRGKPRSWKLKTLNVEVDLSSTRGRVDEEKMNAEYEDFLEDLEENPDMRSNISLYKNKEYRPSEMASVIDDDDTPGVPLEELLGDLEIKDEDLKDNGTRE
uniref:60S ribosomal export protein NMD3-like n=1 Tax=Erigeron canadensis TaxID=72917 RepID=UPI001CB89E1D|nr:60S ribosomal export protein NMD3-like [Erigeron canadensis]